MTTIFQRRCDHWLSTALPSSSTTASDYPPLFSLSLARRSGQPSGHLFPTFSAIRETILPFFPYLWHGGVDSLPTTLFPTFSAILYQPEEKMAKYGRERKTVAAVIDSYSSKRGEKSLHIIERNGRR
ncbi:hypothetical protein Syun_000432 [Stephania yunnanensis]|uniref:Uncharacterized protein n=1 Tax=Stephania yunnanensis TaxID=152371 RepID=A0AAP0Q5B9_9MAGN